MAMPTLKGCHFLAQMFQQQRQNSLLTTGGHIRVGTASRHDQGIVYILNAHRSVGRIGSFRKLQKGKSLRP